MWRNYHEDWERQKTYLIRSLFQDIPALSPVPEESNDGVTSLSGISQSRPYSPLPPLIIERAPNRHDHPDEFYKNLEKKMKKLYKRIFFNVESSSFEDSIEAGENSFDAAQSLNGGVEKFPNDGVINEEYDNILGDITNINRHENRIPKITFGKEPFFHEDEQRCPLNEDKLDTEVSEGFSSSLQSLYATQVTINADVHVQSAERVVEETIENADDDETIVLSPILGPDRIGHNKNLGTERDILTEGEGESEISENVERNEEERILSDVDGSSETEDPNIENDTNLEKTASETSNESMELMRRQRDKSLSLGSIPKDIHDDNSSGVSITYTDIELQKNMSLEKSNQDLSNECMLPEGRNTFPEDVLDNISSLSTSQLYEEQREMFLEENDRRRRSLSHVHTPTLITKKRKFENVSIQTSLDSDCDILTNWKQLKNNFFIGIPKIYKLCACNNHSCENTC